MHVDGTSDHGAVAAGAPEAPVHGSVRPDRDERGEAKVRTRFMATVGPRN